MAETLHRGTRSLRATRPRWPHRSDRAICAQECGARCCQASIVALTETEADVLRERAAALGLSAPEIAPYRDGDEAYLMYAQPCTFLNKSNGCLVYRDRPQHCRDFPAQVLDWCLLSQRPRSR